MSGPFGSSPWLYNPGGGFYDYEIDGSLRFDSYDGSYLERNFSSTGNTKTFTVSFWFKRSRNNINEYLFAWGSSVNDRFHMDINTSGTFQIEGKSGGSTQVKMEGGPILADLSSWYHFVLRVDTTQSTASNRVRLYVNGELMTFNSNTYPGQNAILNYNNNGQFRIGRAGWDTNYFQGYMANFISVDGQSLDPTSFGKSKAGIWIPKEYSGSYGTNGFKLEFNGNTNDTSGNGHNLTAYNLNGSNDYVPDSPTNNFATWNLAQVWSQNNSTFPQVQQGGLRAYFTGFDVYKYITASQSIAPGTGKWYFEIRMANSLGSTNDIYSLGLISNGPDHTPRWLDTYGPQYAYISWRGNTGQRTLYLKDESVSQTTVSVANMTAGDIWQWAYDSDTGKLWVGNNNSWYGSGSPNPSTGTDPTYTFADNTRSLVLHAQGQNYNIGSVYMDLNCGQDSSFFGQRTAGGNSDANGIGDFVYAPPTGFLALCAANMPAPAIDPASDDTPEDYFNTVLWTGNSTSSQSITGVGFQPDFVWAKARPDNSGVNLIDAVRGATKNLKSSSTDNEQTVNTLTSFDSDGFTVGDGNGYDINKNGESVVGWCWLAGNGTTSNSTGSITTTVSANQDAGFSILTYTGNATSGATLGHGLASAPEMIITKFRQGGSPGSGWLWPVYHKDVGTGYYLRLQATDGRTSNSQTVQSVGASTYTIGNDGHINQASGNFVAYCFHSVEGYSKIGSYAGNGANKGPYVYTGFRPAFVFRKKFSASGSWYMQDNRRPGNNKTGTNQGQTGNEGRNWWIRANSTAAESTAFYGIEILSNGFRITTAEGDHNSTGVDYLYMAIAEQPFKYANARI
jgi:hypothetical protein